MELIIGSPQGRSSGKTSKNKTKGGPVADTSLLIDVIKLELKAQAKTYADVAVALDMSESSVKRMFSRKEMPLTRVDDICRILAACVGDIMKG